jgi:hypothetical protein
MARLTFLFGADGSAAGVADGSDAAGGVVLAVVGVGVVAGGAGKPPAIRNLLACVAWRAKENDDAES